MIFNGNSLIVAYVYLRTSGGATCSEGMSTDIPSSEDYVV